MLMQALMWWVFAITATIFYGDLHLNQTSLRQPMSKKKYKCPHCNKIVLRNSDKKWIGSYCEEKGKNVRLQKQ